MANYDLLVRRMARFPPKRQANLCNQTEGVELEIKKLNKEWYFNDQMHIPLLVYSLYLISMAKYLTFFTGL